MAKGFCSGSCESLQAPRAPAAPRCHDTPARCLADPCRSRSLPSLAGASCASLASTVVPWLLSGGTLVLHHPFAPAVFEQQRASEQCRVAVLPGPMVAPLVEGGLIGHQHDLQTVIAVAGTVSARSADRSVSPQLLPASAPAA